MAWNAFLCFEASGGPAGLQWLQQDFVNMYRSCLERTGQRHYRHGSVVYFPFEQDVVDENDSQGVS